MDTPPVTSGTRPYQTMALPDSTLAERTRAMFEGPLIHTHHDTHIASIIITASTSDRARPQRNTSLRLQWTSPGLKAKPPCGRQATVQKVSRPTYVYSNLLVNINYLFSALLFIWPAVHPKNRPGQRFNVFIGRWNRFEYFNVRLYTHMEVIHLINQHKIK